MQSAPRLLLISGWAHKAEALNPLGRFLAEVAEVTIMTTAELWSLCRSHGAANQWALTLAEKAAQLGEEIIIAGWSMGGLVALETASLYPSLFKSLILISSTPKFCSSHDWKQGTRPAMLRAMLSGIKRAGGTTFVEFFKKAALPEIENEKDLKYKIMAAQTMNQLELSAGLQYLLSTDLRKRLRTIAIPVLVIHGREDAIIPVEAGRALHELLPNSSIKIIDGGHGLPWQAPGTVAEIMKEFIQKCQRQNKSAAIP